MRGRTLYVTQLNPTRHVHDIQVTPVMTSRSSRLNFEGMLDLAVKEITEDGIFWITWGGFASQKLKVDVEKRLDQSLYMHCAPPTNDFIIVDTTRHPDWHDWIDSHAMLRAKLLARGVAEDDLPLLPYDKI